MITPKQTATIVKAILASFPRDLAKFSESMIVNMNAAYHRVLGDLPFELVDAATTRALREATYMPSAGEIRKAAVAGVAGPKRSSVDAFADVLKAIGKVGVHRLPPPFVDAIVQQCVDSMGWTNLCNAPPGDAPTRARFCLLYDDTQNGSRSEAVVSTGLVPSARRLERGASIAELIAGPKS